VSDRYDLVVLGGGTGGLVSALIAADVGARVALIERDRVGGDCLWTGCVPSKSLIAAATLAHRMRHADSVGLAPTDPNIDFARVMDRVQRAILTIEAEDPPERLRNAGIDLLHGSGRFAGPGMIDVDDRELRWRSAIIATGSTPQIPPIPGLDDADSLTTDTVWQLRELPARLVVLGGGPVGCELAQAFARLGSKVTVVEMADRLLLKEDPRASELIASRLREDGIDVRLGQRGTEVRPRPGGDHELVLEGSGEAVSFERVIVATGRAPRTAGLGLETVGVELDRDGAVAVNSGLRTSVRGIFAVGDVTGLLPFTHVAAHHARVATPNALFKARGKVTKTIPWVTFTDPEVGRVGLTERQARERWGEKARITEFEYAKLDRAITAGEAYGFAKLVADSRGRLVGATVAAPGGGDAIAELTARIARRDKIDAVSRTVHAYPTLAEGPARAADEYVEARYTSPRMRALTRRALALLRLTHVGR
jgi:pyruvate/2-oxoglutarate dehydrogenase complex dihydrolipoamide dehydrogenase (E3) component